MKPVFRNVDFRALDRRGRIHMLGTHDAAFPDKRAVPDAIVVADDFALILSLVARVHVVAVAECDGGWTQKLRLKPVNRAGRVAQHAINTLSELMERLELGRRL